MRAPGSILRISTTGPHAIARVLLLAAGAVWTNPAGAQQPASGTPAPSRWATVVRQAGGDRELLEELAEALSASANPAAKLEVLKAVETAASPVDALGPIVAGVLDQPVDAETLAAALRALALFQTRDAVAPVIRFAQSAKDLNAGPALYDLAMDTLARQTARDDVSRDVGSWKAWLEWAPQGEPEWSRLIARQHAERSHAAISACREAELGLAGVYRRLLVSLEPAQRSAVIAEMLGSPVADVRGLAADQATRAVLNAQSVGPEVAAAALARLDDPDPVVRAQMAGLLEKLDAPGIGPRVAAALARESLAAPAAAMLRVLIRNPEASALRDIAAWLDSSGPAFEPAVDAALALDRAGVMTDPDLLQRVHDVLGALPPRRHTPGTVSLLARVGRPHEVEPLLSAPSPEVIAAAGRALVNSASSFEALTAAAAKSPLLFESAVGAIGVHRPTADGFAMAQRLPSPTPERRADALLKLAAALPPAELLAVCTAETDLVMRERLASAPPGGPIDGAAPDAAQRRDLALLLARTRLQLKKPDAALEGLDAALPAAPAPIVDAGTTPSTADAWCAPLRVVALAWLNRVSEAVALSRRVEIPIDPWIEALEFSAELPHARAIRSVIDELYASRLTGTDRSRLESIDRRLNGQGPPELATPETGIQP